MQETLRIDSLSRVFRVLEVTHANISTSHADLTLLFTFCPINLHLCSWESSSYLQVILHALKGQHMGISAAFWGCAFCHPVSIPEENIESKEVSADGGV
jgi:hypothetical protein